MNALNCLKHVQYFDVHSFYWEKKERKKEKNIQFNLP